MEGNSSAAHYPYPDDCREETPMPENRRERQLAAREQSLTPFNYAAHAVSKPDTR